MLSKPDQLYATSHLVKAIRRKTLPTSQIDVILMGTNDVRHGTTDVAVDNFNLVKASVEANKTVVAHIPPIEIGNPDDDEYEEKATDRIILNRHISTTLPDNHIKIPSIQKSHHRESILTSDGFHLKKGGEMMANAIAARIKKMIAPVPPPNVQEPQIPPTQPTPKPQAPKSKHPKQELSWSSPRHRKACHRQEW